MNRSSITSIGNISVFTQNRVKKNSKSQFIVSGFLKIFLPLSARNKKLEIENLKVG